MIVHPRRLCSIIVAAVLFSILNATIALAQPSQPTNKQALDLNADGQVDFVDVVQSSENRSFIELKVYLGERSDAGLSLHHSTDIRLPLADIEISNLHTASMMDWNADQQLDVIAVVDDQLIIWLNSGELDEHQHPSFLPGQKILLLSKSEYQHQLEQLAPHHIFRYRGITLIDWNDDGDGDLLLTKGTAGEDPLAFFEILENQSSPDGKPNYDASRVLRDARGLPILSLTESPGVQFLDWDRDGDLDVVFFDRTTRPSAAGGWLMFAENDGTRQQPSLIGPVAIVEISCAAQVFDWNNDSCFDLIVGDQLFENVNPKSGSNGPLEHSFRSNGSRRPHPWTLPRFVAAGRTMFRHSAVSPAPDSAAEFRADQP